MSSHDNSFRYNSDWAFCLLWLHWANHPRYPQLCYNDWEFRLLWLHWVDQPRYPQLRYKRLGILHFKAALGCIPDGSEDCSSLSRLYELPQVLENITFRGCDALTHVVVLSTHKTRRLKTFYFNLGKRKIQTPETTSTRTK